jgi:hypothetical protein
MVTTLNERVIKPAAAAHAVPVLDARNTLAGHRLCENTVGLLEERGVANWTVPGAADQTEWVSQIRTVTTLIPPYQLQEDLHPSYWGQLALRNCVRQVYTLNRGGTCRSEGGMDGAEPNMALD